MIEDDIEYRISLKITGYKHHHGEKPNFLIVSPDIYKEMLSDPSWLRLASVDYFGTHKYMGMLICQIDTSAAINQIILGR